VPTRRSLALLALALAACPARPAAAATFVYVHDYGVVNQVFGFALSKRGELERLPGSPFEGPDAATSPINQCAGNCQTMAYLKDARLLLTAGPGGVTPWRVGEDGALEAVAGAPFGPAPSLYFGVAGVELRDARFAFVADYGGASLYGFRVLEDGSLEDLATGFPIGTGGGPLGIVSHKGFVALVNSEDNTVSSFTIAEDGTMAPGPESPVPFDSTLAFTLNLDGRGRNLYVGDQASPAAFLFRVTPKTGSVALREDSPVPTGLPNTGLGFALTKGRRALVFSIGGEVQAFRRQGGKLRSLGPPADLGFVPLAQALSPNRSLLAAADNLELQLLRVRARGRLRLVAGAPLGAGNVNAVLVVSR
jgi:hypothetical protein